MVRRMVVFIAGFWAYSNPLLLDVNMGGACEIL